MIDLEPLLSLDAAGLRRAFAGGHAIDPHALDDSEYLGVSLGLPALVDRLAWKTFRKVFHRDRSTGRLRGWNVRLRQTGLAGPFEPLTRRGRPRTFGHFEVIGSEHGRLPSGAVPGLLIDYGRGQGHRLDPIRRLRDPLVALRPGSADLLLGWSYLDLGRVCLPTPSYFVLARTGPLRG